jgi:two-component system sensor kinase
VGEGVDEALSALEVARRRRILWTKGPEGRYAFVHDKLRDAMLELLPPDERRALHRLAAVHIEQAQRTRVFELAYHFDAAGEPDRALPYALAAAEEARTRHALELAEQHYRIAARGAAEGERVLRRRIAEGFGDVLMLHGRYPEAARELEEASALAEDPRTLARIEGKKGELAFKRGDVKQASRAIERALRLLGRHVPRWHTVIVGMTLWEAFVQAVHTTFPRLLGRRSLEGAEDALLAVRLYNRLAYVYWFERGMAPTLWAHLRGMNLAERYPPTPELAQAYSEHAPVITQIPLFRRGVAYAEKSLAIRTALGDVWGQGQSLHFLGVVLYNASRYAESIEKCRAAIRLLERTGDRWEVNTARWHTAFALYRLGELRAAVEESRRVHQAGLEIGDHQATGISLGAWAKASGGRVPAGLIRAELQRHGEDAHTAAEVLQAEGIRWCGEGQPAAAAQVFEEAQRGARRAGLRNEYVAPILPWLATALREAAEATPAWAPARRAALVRRADRAARRGLRTARRYRNNLPHALRECALAAAMRGRERRAETLLARSLAVAEQQHARFEHALTLLARGRVGVARGRPDAAADLAAARQALAALGADFVRDDGPSGSPGEEPATLSLVDRFSTVLDVGRRIASALVPYAVLSAVREAALTLLRGEHCTVFRVVHRDGRSSLIESHGGDGEAVHLRALVEHSVATVRPRVFNADRPGEIDEGLIVAGIKSALCAPIVARGRVVACFCVTHGQVAGLFGAVEERLAEFIAAIAGAALENAEGFAEIEALSRSLEQRVGERTAELSASNQENAVASSLLRATLESTADGIVVIDREGRISSFNQKFLEMWRLPASVVQAGAEDRSLAVMLRQLSDVEGFGSRARELAANPELESYDVLELRDGRVFERYSLPQRIGSECVGRVYNFRDITERRRAERELEKRADELGRSNAELEQFAYVASHDLQEPLRMVASYVQLLQRRYRGQLEGEADQFIAYAVDGVTRMQTLINDLLAYSRVGTQAAAFAPVSFENVWTQATARLQAAIQETGASLVHDPLPAVTGDAAQLVQVLQNLIANALKFRGTDPPRISLTVERWGALWVFSLRDNGIGIEADFTHRLFVMFKRLHSMSEYPGSGIGLAICKKIVERHGGRIWIDSPGAGRGTTVSFVLPALVVEAGKDTEPVASPAA